MRNIENPRGSEIQATDHMESGGLPLYRLDMQGYGQGERGSEQGDGPKTRSELIELAQTEDRVVPPEAFRDRVNPLGTYEHHTKVLIPGSSEFLVVGDNNGHTVYAGTPETVERLRADFWRWDDRPKAHNILTEALHPHMTKDVFDFVINIPPRQEASLTDKFVRADRQEPPRIRDLEADPQPDAIVEFGRHYERYGVKVEKQEISLDNINAALLTGKSVLLWSQITEGKPMMMLGCKGAFHELRADGKQATDDKQTAGLGGVILRDDRRWEIFSAPDKLGRDMVVISHDEPRREKRARLLGRLGQAHPDY